MAERGIDRYDELHAGFRWQVPARFNIAEVCCTRWARADARARSPSATSARTARARDFSYARARPRRRPPGRGAAAARRRSAATGSRSSCRSASRPRWRTSRCTSSARSRCRCRCCSAPRRSSTASATASARLAIVDESGDRQRARGAAALPAAGDAGRGRRRRRAGRRRLGRRCSPAPAHAFDAGRHRAPTTPAVLIYTSGTTGPPKGALMPHRALIGNLPGFVCSQNWFAPRQDDEATSFWSPGRLGLDRRPDGRAAADALLRPRDRRLPGPLRARAGVRADGAPPRHAHLPLPDRAEGDDEGGARSRAALPLGCARS